MRTYRALPVLVLLVLGAPAMPDSAVRLAAQVPKHNCSFCHDLHGTGFGQLTKAELVKDLCDSCHGAVSPPTYKRDGVDVAIPKQGRGAPANSFFAIHDGQVHTDNSQAPTGCWDCHNHEGRAGSNLKMIRAQMVTPNSGTKTTVFTAYSGSGSFAEGAEPYDGVCEVCHTYTKFHKNNGTGTVHNAAADCNTCHKHSDGFQGSGGRCTSCHNSAQSGTNSRRAIVGEFDRSTHHVDWAAAEYLEADSIPDSDCLVCHEQGDGHPGSDSNTDLIFKNADNPATTYTVVGDPNTVAAQAEILTPFCLACHQDGSAGGDPTPFSDNVAIPTIGEGQAVSSVFWSDTSSHGTGSVSCYGDGTFGCHASGHGSEKSPLLGLVPSAAPDSGSSGNALYYEQEGFCFNCHNSSITPNTLNIEDQFKTTINWAQEAAGANSTVLLNDRHDVQHAAQSTSGAAIECVACHDPHRATEAQKIKRNPDPSDGVVPAIGARLPSDLQDYMTEWCLDCHDNSFPTGVNSGTDGLTNIAVLWSTAGSGDKHGGTARGSTSFDTEPISDWVPIESIVTTPGKGGKPPTVDTTYVANVFVPCWGCHATHPMRQDQLDDLVDTQGRSAALNNLFQIKPWVTKRDGTTVIPPDVGAGFGTHTQVTNNASSASVLERGEGLCYTCHYYQMQNTNCFRCHYHNTGNRF